MAKPQLLALNYDGHSEAFDVIAPQFEDVTIHDGTVVKGIVFGGVPVRSRMTLDEMQVRNPRLHDVAVELLNLLLEETQVKSAEVVADPEAVRAQANANLQKEAELHAKERALHDETQRLQKLHEINKNAAENAEALRAAAEAEHAHLVLEAQKAKAEAEAAKAEVEAARVAKLEIESSTSALA